MRNTRHESRQKDKQATRLPQPGRKKQNPRELDKLLDKGLADSMAASDPVEVTQPDVHAEADRVGVAPTRRGAVRRQS